MRKHSFIATAILILLFCISPDEAVSQWVSNGREIYTGTQSQNNPRIIETSEGGAIIVWDDQRLGQKGIYAQKVDALGQKLWASGGIQVCDSIRDALGHVIVQDGTGGAIIAWKQYDIISSEWDIYAQHISSSGDIIWASGDVAVATSPGNQQDLQIATDGSGGAIITWQDYQSPTVSDIYAQRIDTDGNVMWTAGGVPVCTEASAQSLPCITSNGSGGAVIAWEDNRNYASWNTDIYAQMIDSNGTALWGIDGKGVCEYPSRQEHPQITRTNNDYFIIVWRDRRSDEGDIYAIRMSMSGSIGMQINGKALCAAAGEQSWSMLVPDYDIGAFVVWADERNGEFDIYAQRVSWAGVIYWTTNGVAVCSTDDVQNYPQLIGDGINGVIIAWNDYRNRDEDIYTGDVDLFAQRLSSDSTSCWTTDGVPISTAADNQSNANLVGDGYGGGIIAWTDTRDMGTNMEDIYAQRISRNGNWGSNEPYILIVSDIPNDQGGRIQIGWRRSSLDFFDFNEALQYTVWRRLPGQSVPLCFDPDAVPEIPLPGRNPDSQICLLAANGWMWEWLATIPAGFFGEYAYSAVSLSDSTDLDPALQYFMVRLHTHEQMEFYDSQVASGYSVDNLAPSQPSPIVGEQSFDPEGLNLSWEDNEDPDLAYYNVYRGTGEDFNPVPGSGSKLPAAPGELIASPSTSAFFDYEWTWDSEYWYGIAAVDVHGNESDLSVFGPGGVTSDDPAPLPDATFLSQNFPNPFNPITTIAFGLKESGYVSLRIYDAAGRLVTTLIDESRPAGSYSAEWNGLNTDGSAAASGVYFYRLRTGEFEETKKMILLR